MDASFARFLYSFDFQIPQNTASSTLHSLWVYATMNQNSIIPASYVALVVLFFCFINALRHARSSSKRMQSQRHKTPSTALDSLLQIFTPSCSRWPAYYADAASKAHSSSDNTIHLQLHPILRHLSVGTIEPRDPETIMTELLKGRITKLGWAIVISAHCPLDDNKFSRPSLGVLSDILRIRDWESSGNSFGRIEQPSFPSTSGSAPEFALDDSCSRLPFLTKFPNLLLQEPLGESRVTLDFIPVHLLNTAIRGFQSNLNPQIVCTIEFSTQPTVDRSRISSRGLTQPYPFSLLLVLFSFLRTDATCGSTHESSFTSHSTAPLYTTLASIINLLTSGPHALEVMHVQDISREYVCDLISRGSLGVDTSRTKGGLTRWYAALFDNVDHVRGLGVLGRYAVIVCKRRLQS